MSLRFVFILFATAAMAAQMPNDVYVWQRAWNRPVLDALNQQSTNFQHVIALAAEVSWKDKQPRITRVPLDHAALRECGRPCGLAMRIGPSAGPFRSNDPTALKLAALANSLVEGARSNRLSLAEIHLDFDCAESRLDGYRVWVELLRREIAPVPLVLTALPSWLRQPAFARLAAAADGYILQVHSLERPRSFNAPFTLCDPTAARRAVEAAGKLPIPFRVALPTYGYRVAFDVKDKFIGLTADGPAIEWPADTRIRTVRSNPAEIAGLVADWSTNRPAAMRGIIWYRLPVAGEDLNWRPRTLELVKRGQVPQADVKVESRSSAPLLREIFLRNNGAADFQDNIAIRARISRGRLVAGDALAGFDADKSSGGTVEFRATNFFLPAGATRAAGWLRLNKEAEVELELRK